MKNERSLLNQVWHGMISRCHKPHDYAYDRYGGRGIWVCLLWRDSFDQFIADMGPRPSRSHSIERRNNGSGYYKENCYWATRMEQTRNRRSNVWVTYGGETAILKDMALMHGKNYNVLYARVVTHGWTIDEAIEKPIQRGGDRRSGKYWRKTP